MSTTIWIDGKWYDRSTATISVFDHGLLYGDGVFEGTRAYNGKVFRLKEHIARLFDSARCICLTPPISQEELISITEEGVRRSRSAGSSNRRASSTIRFAAASRCGWIQ